MNGLVVFGKTPAYLDRQDWARRSIRPVEPGKTPQSDGRKMEDLAILAHEIRNPLAAIRSAVRILEVQEAPAYAVERARMIIDRQLNQIMRLVDELLHRTGAAAATLELHKERIDLAGIVRTAVEACQPLIDAGGHTLIVRLLSDAVYVEADASRLVRVLVNLLDNAAKYSERCGEIMLSVELHGGETLIRVQDDGIGIHPDMLPRVFDPFMRASYSSDGCRGGLGIGLALVKHTVELHGGTVEAHSAGLGYGSVFVVRLPVPELQRDIRGMMEPSAIRRFSIP